MAITEVQMAKAKKTWASASGRVAIMQRAGFFRKWSMWQNTPWSSLPLGMKQELTRIIIANGKRK